MTLPEIKPIEGNNILDSVNRWWEHPYKLVSLGDIVYQINAAGFIETGNNLRLYQLVTTLFEGPVSIFEGNVSINVELDQSLPADGSRKLIETLRNLRDQIEGIGLSVTLEKLSRVVADYEEQLPTWRKLGRDCADIQERLTDELRVRLFLAVEPTRARFYNQPLGGWESAAERLPKISFDVEEAGKCLALNRGTACVLHLMRVLEVGMYAIADGLGVENIQENWQNAIQQIEKAARKLAKPDPLQQFASEAAAYLFHVKDAWRNSAVHSGPVYTIEHAERIYENVRGFMQHLATQPQEGS